MQTGLWKSGLVVFSRPMPLQQWTRQFRHTLVIQFYLQRWNHRVRITLPYVEKVGLQGSLVHVQRIFMGVGWNLLSYQMAELAPLCLKEGYLVPQ